MQRDDYKMKQGMPCEENNKWQSERPDEDKCRAVVENTDEAEIEGKAGNVHLRITQRPRLLGE